MHLARALLNPVSRDVMRGLADPVALHRTILRAYPDGLGTSTRERAGILFRVDAGRGGDAVLVVQSSVRPDFGKLPPTYFVDSSDERLFSFGWPHHPFIEALDRSAVTGGARFRFRLRANATRKIDTKTGPDGKRRHGKRVPLRGDSERMQWLSRKAERAGFRVLDARVVEERPTHGRHEGGLVTVAGARFDGLLEVVDAERFVRDALDRGIGPAKAFGFGLLSIIPA
jgi:CRISPR system Cascade subunit CasE